MFFGGSVHWFACISVGGGKGKERVFFCLQFVYFLSLSSWGGSKARLQLSAPGCFASLYLGAKRGSFLLVLVGEKRGKVLSFLRVFAFG